MSLLAEGSASVVPGPLDQWELTQLATFNAERARGIIHTQHWQRRMAGLQDRFDMSGILIPKKKWYRP